MHCWQYEPPSIVPMACCSSSVQKDSDLVLRCDAIATPRERFIDEPKNQTDPGSTEAFMHVAIYCGVPKANHAFKIAKETYKEMGISL